MARRCSEFPECVDALHRGELSLDQLAPITRHAPAWSDAQMAGLAPRCTAAQISKIAREYPWSLERDETTGDVHAGANDAVVVDQPPSSPIPQPRDEAWFGWDDRGRFRLALNVGAETGAVIEHALAEARDALFHAGDPSVETVDAGLAITDARSELASGDGGLHA